MIYELYIKFKSFCYSFLLFILLVPPSFAQQPVNDDCANPIQLIVGADPVDGTTFGATSSPLNSTYCNYNKSDVWFSFVAPLSNAVPPASNILIEVTELNSADWGILMIDEIQYSTACGAASPYPCVSSCSTDPTTADLAFMGLTPGETYYVSVWNNSGPSDFNIRASDFTPVVSIDYSDCDMDNYSIDVEVPDLICGQLVDITNSTGDFPYMDVGTGTYKIPRIAAEATVTVTVTYPGNPDITVNTTITTPAACPPPNDFCATATSLPVGSDMCASQNVVTNTGASATGVAPTCPGYTGGDIWYSFIAPPAGEITIETSNDGSGIVDTHIEVFDACGGASTGCSDSGVPGTETFAVLHLTDLTPGTTYYAVVWTSNNELATFNICAWGPCTRPEFEVSIDNSNCENDTYDLTVIIEETGSAFNLNIANDANGQTWNEVRVGEYSFTGFFSTVDTMLSVTIRMEDADNPNCFEDTIIVIPTDCPPSNDSCTTAIPLVVGEGSCTNLQIGSNYWAGNSVIMSCEDGDDPENYEGRDVWFSFITPEEGEVIIETSFAGTPDFDTVIELFDACGDTSMYCNNNGGEGNYSKLELSDLIPGSTYYIGVWEYNNNMGEFNICAWEPCHPVFELSVDNTGCENDNNAIVVNITDLGSTSNLNITNDTNSSSVPGAGTGEHTLTGFSAGSTVEVFLSNAVCNETLSITIPVCAPDNDLCSGAFSLPVSPGFCLNPVNGTNLSAGNSVTYATSFSINTITCNGYQGGDVWFKFIAPASGQVNIETSDDGSGDFDTVIEVFDFCDFGTSLGCDDESSLVPGSNASLIELTGLTPGSSYYVVVWEFQNDHAGTFNICAWDPSLAAPDCTGDYAGGSLANSYPALSGTLNINRDFESAGSIHSAQVIGSAMPVTVDYDSASDILLMAGFEVRVGSTFYGFIDGCNDGGGGVLNQNDNNINVENETEAKSNNSVKSEPDKMPGSE